MVREPEGEAEMECAVCYEPFTWPYIVNSVDSTTRIVLCCGKQFCSCCLQRLRSSDAEAAKCPFCRTTLPVTAKEITRMLQHGLSHDKRWAFEVAFNLYSEGRHGLDKDLVLAFTYAKKAASSGSIVALHYLGLCYEYGSGVALSIPHAAQYYSDASKKGLGSSSWALGILYSEGRDGIVASHETALTYFNSAMSQV
jgi:hypothetical protein